MIVVRERKRGSWRSLSRDDIEDVASEVALRGRLEGVLSWAEERLDTGDAIRIKIEDKATLRIRAWSNSYSMSGSVKSTTMFLEPTSPPGSLDELFKRGVDLLASGKEASFKDPGLQSFRMRLKDGRFLFSFLVVKV